MTTNLAAAAIKSTGSLQKRTLGARFGDITNVKDFGAAGDGSTDDTTAIQNAINAAGGGGANRGTIFFPLGSYVISTSLTFNYNGVMSIAFVAVPGTFIICSPAFNDYAFKRTLGTPNYNPGGCIVFEGFNIQNGAAGGGIKIGSANGVYIRDCLFNAYVGVTAEDTAGNSSQNIMFENCVFTSGNTSGSHGIIMGGGGSVMTCNMHGVETGMRFYGFGFSTSGNRIENCGTAIVLGVDSAGTDQGASGFSIISQYMEGVGVAVDFVGTCSGFFLGGVRLEGHDASNGPGTTRGFYIRADKAKAGVFMIGTSSWISIGGIVIENATSRANLVFMSCDGSQSGSTGTGWILPTNAYTAQLINCNIPTIWTFSQLPSGGNIFEGDEFDISDSTTATWGANVTVGGGSNRVRVRYNSANWTVMGK